LRRRRTNQQSAIGRFEVSPQSGGFEFDAVGEIGNTGRRNQAIAPYALRAIFKTPGFWHGCSMTTIEVEKAQQDLMTLVKRALDGEEIVIQVDSRKIRLAPIPAVPVFDAATARRRGYGSMRGQFEVTDSFFEPLPEDELKFWEEQDIA
jgi:antitoxin (DNA-binding transcriptional repressor) of toxin-antitoxin stability system